MGSRLRQLRRERDLSQASLAETLGLSPSYVNQIEHDVRPLTVPVLMRITEAFGVDATFFSRDDDSRLLAELQDVVLDKELCPSPVELQELSELVYNHPSIARTIVDMHRRYCNVRDKLSLATDTRHRSSSEALAMPHEEVRDFFYARQNYFDDIDKAAEKLARDLNLQRANNRSTEEALVTRLHSHGVSIHLAQSTDVASPEIVSAGSSEIAPPPQAAPAAAPAMSSIRRSHSNLGADTTQHRFDAETRRLYLAEELSTGQRCFRMATELAHLEHDLVDIAIADAGFSGEAAAALATRGVASYFAAALLMPYTSFHNEAERQGYDIDYLRQVFGMGYETTCHRLSTLQRPGLRGIPFTFVRVDRAGNVSKRQSATGFHFSNSGGTCPLWNVYETFSDPGTIKRQVAQMPDGRTYFWVARTVRHRSAHYTQPGKLFSIGLGCDIRHAHRTVYSQGLDLSNLGAATPIGVGCRVCSRSHCAQRAFPQIHAELHIDAHRSSVAPYD